MSKLPLHSSGLTKLAVRQHETGSKPLGRTALLVLEHWQEVERLKAIIALEKVLNSTKA